MRIHTSVINRLSTLDTALASQQQRDRIADHVSFKTIPDPHGSSIRRHAFEIQLEADRRDRGRRAGNSGSYGAMRAEVDGYAATYDEWGWFLAALYDLDPDMIVGSPSSPTYRSKVHFHRVTGFSYAPAFLIETITQEGADPFPYVTGAGARTKRGYLIGRQGAGRLPREEGEEHVRRGWPVKEAPRTITQVAEFGRLTEAEVERAIAAGTPKAEVAL